MMTVNIDNENEQGIKNLIVFFVLSLGITWLLDLPKVLVDNGLADLPKGLVFLSNLGPWGPFIAGFGLIYKSKKWEGVKGFWRRGWRFDFDKRWLFPVFFLPVLTAGLTILFVNLTGGEILWEHQPLPPMLAVPIFIAIFLSQALPEEYGWRGYALDRLQLKWNALTASLILGLVWGLWHLPLHFMAGTTQAVIPIGEFWLKQMVTAVFFTWIYNNTNRSIFLAMLFHAVGNVMGGLVPFWVTSHGRWVNFSVEVILGIALVVVFGAKTLTRKNLRVEENHAQ